MIWREGAFDIILLFVGLFVGGTRVLEIGWGVPLALSKPGPVAISLMAQNTPCPNFEKNTEFNSFVYGVIATNLRHVLMISSSPLIFFSKIFIVRLKILMEFGLIDLRNQQKNITKPVPNLAGSSKKHPLPILEAQK